MKEYFEKIFKGSSYDFYNSLREALICNQKKFIVTANPEAFMLGSADIEMDKLLKDTDVTVVADGIGLVKGAKMIGIDITERIPGVEIAQKLFEYANELSLSVFLFGAKQEVISKLCDKINNEYPNIQISGAKNGYSSNKDTTFNEIKKLKPDIILVALGMPTQEKLIYKHFNDFKKGVFVGVGGSFDVLSGMKSRAPEFYIKHNLEWFYRIVCEPKRIKRFYNNNIKFLFKLKK